MPDVRSMPKRRSCKSYPTRPLSNTLPLMHVDGCRTVPAILLVFMDVFFCLRSSWRTSISKLVESGAMFEALFST